MFEGGIIIIKYYGKLVRNTAHLTDETILYQGPGVLKDSKGKWYCRQCATPNQHDYYTYTSAFHQQTITYCRRCLQLGRMDTVQMIAVTETAHYKSSGEYHLDFQLSQQQAYASSHIIRAIQTQEILLLYAVTGAGKTEMMFEGIRYARQEGLNVAIVSPRVDVVVEISKRIIEAFSHEAIDVLYQGQSQKYCGHFVVATVHQLYRFKQHFDVIFIDEVDAFPLAMDPLLMQTLIHASASCYSHIYMTATPSKHLLKQFKKENIITLPARYHRKPLPVPKFRYFKFKPQRLQPYLLKLLQKQIENKRVTLVFFNQIEAMEQALVHYQKYFDDLAAVHSEDALRFEKVEALRAGKHRIIFTTTILERGFTMAHLDVIVLESQTFQAAALVQIAGRTGRKLQDTSGNVLFLHNGVTLAMLSAKRQIQRMNRLGFEKGWLDAEM
ncbi:DEAD/DEAH box helicase family protein [Staphylococcus sp. EZ-P03]|uniref:DEAD/DEAH box helicase family protein n=1 Tax=Staphylococcus sp. EZ-P03 TaxID=2282739 RepID=UPI001F08CD2C|nr:DEAD/DEAH box helicase family protein [Staphylococcus sp. EZ-P03]